MEPASSEARTRQLDDLIGSTRRHPPARPRVLVVEDEPVGALVTARMLTRLGYATDAARSGREALDRCSASPLPYAAVLLDYFLPDVNGAEVARRLRERAGGHRLTLLALVPGHADDLFRETGVDDRIVKPISLELLAATLGRWAPLGRAGSSPPAA